MRRKHVVPATSQAFGLPFIPGVALERPAMAPRRDAIRRVTTRAQNRTRDTNRVVALMWFFSLGWFGLERTLNPLARRRHGRRGNRVSVAGRYALIPPCIKGRRALRSNLGADVHAWPLER